MISLGGLENCNRTAHQLVLHGFHCQSRQNWVWNMGHGRVTMSRSLTAPKPQFLTSPTGAIRVPPFGYPWQWSSGRIPRQHLTKDLWHPNIKYVSTFIILMLTCSHKTLIQQLFTIVCARRCVIKTPDMVCALMEFTARMGTVTWKTQTQNINYKLWRVLWRNRVGKSD